MRRLFNSIGTVLRYAVCRHMLSLYCTHCTIWSTFFLTLFILFFSFHGKALYLEHAQFHHIIFTTIFWRQHWIYEQRLSKDICQNWFSLLIKSFWLHVVLQSWLCMEESQVLGQQAESLSKDNYQNWFK